ncbi:carbon-nitrogen hydrolase family protein [Stenomitos frigidus]|uniref:Carbon-nitrogen hydrolase n=1 Tax=Stenomitos frigidus ULC18 TaxID=2107698 RepID=A0A2T1ELK7_9CYAN|nr:carbon-nitrogen hydrolase family protein [Stenomitos frigidus]PSB33616.1 carbon-nitrogen hydrolase [Stenomitos frigidus ULC18]
MKLAIYQGAGIPKDVTANLTLLARMSVAAAKQQVNLLIFPELFLTGYNIGDAVKELAEPFNGRSLQFAASLARESKLALLFGYVERDGKTLYNSAALIDADGNLAANYRKAHLFGAEEQRLFMTGRERVLHTIAGVRVGVLICYDVEFPEAVRALALQGAELIAVPTALMFPYTQIPLVLIPTRALENQVFVAYANRIGVEGNLKYCGLSTIAAPDGTVLAQAGADETLLVADLDPAAIAETRSIFSYLDDRRPELY